MTKVLPKKKNLVGNKRRRVNDYFFPIKREKNVTMAAFEIGSSNSKSDLFLQKKKYLSGLNNLTIIFLSSSIAPVILCTKGT